MSREIERKYLVVGDEWRRQVTGDERIRQGYLALEGDREVRVRLADDQATLTVKSGGAVLDRLEVEAVLRPGDAARLLDEALSTDEILKRRYRVPARDLEFEVDVFEGANAGLIIAEVELPADDTPVPDLPWLGPEITGDARYYNANLALRPFSRW